MKKVICFSLWGENPRYTLGAIENTKLAKEIFPDWMCRFYIGSSTPSTIVDKLSKTQGVEIKKMSDKCDWSGMFWRFLAASDPEVDIMISRDCDSRLIMRDKIAVDQWLDSNKGFHVIRDHRNHGVAILGGMWGAKKGTVDNMEDLIAKDKKGDYWQVDQIFLKNVIWPLVKNDVLVHDEFFIDAFGARSQRIKCIRDPEHFIGQAYAGDNKILDSDNYFIDRIKLNDSSH